MLMPPLLTAPLAYLPADAVVVVVPAAAVVAVVVVVVVIVVVVVFIAKHLVQTGQLLTGFLTYGSNTVLL